MSIDYSSQNKCFKVYTVGEISWPCGAEEGWHSDRVGHVFVGATAVNAHATMLAALEAIYKAAHDDREHHDGLQLHSLGCDRSLELIEEFAAAAIAAGRGDAT